MAFAKQYYACNDIQGVYLENQGGSGTARLVSLQCQDRCLSNVYSSHWEKRTLHHEVMNGYISRCAIVSSHFTSGIYFTPVVITW